MKEADLNLRRDGSQGKGVLASMIPACHAS